MIQQITMEWMLRARESVCLISGRLGQTIFRRRVLALIAGSTLIFMASCAHVAPREVPTRTGAVRACVELLEALDKEAEKWGIRNAADAQIAGYPYLRTNRFLAAMKDRLAGSEGTDQWLELMRRLDLAGREKEIGAMGDEALRSLAVSRGMAPDRGDLLSRVAECSETVAEHDRARPGLLGDLKPRVRVPDEYSSLLRTVGLFPFSSVPVNFVSERVRREISAWFRRPVDSLQTEGRLNTFAPAARKVLSRDEVARIISASSDNPLGIPLPHPAQAENLASSFAPVIIQDVAASYDLPGRVTRGKGRLRVDVGNPTVYFYLTHGLHGSGTILQLNYVLWYAERAGGRSPRIERGKFDGLTYRVSLDVDGNPLMVDIMNNCGCYHLFVPDRDAIRQVRSGKCPLGPFVPQWLPPRSPTAVLGIRVNSGWHQVERVVAIEVVERATPYEILPYDTLEALPADGGLPRSMFSGRGILDESRRIEPYILFSMGIPSIGSMRQRGHHAIDLTCRVHFDDPRLFEKSFLWK